MTDQDKNEAQPEDTSADGKESGSAPQPEEATSESPTQQRVIPPLGDEAEEKKKGGCISPLGIMACTGILLVLAAILVPNFIRARSRGQLTACKSNLKNIGTAFEMYSTDWSGKYPRHIDMLTPNYLKTIPECPATGSITYQAVMGSAVAYNNPGFDDYYFVQCSGENHTAVNVQKDYPQYDGISGLIER
jgi:type II secretory pathway pseudopilin PulG